MNNMIGKIKRSLREALMVVGSICLCLLAFSCNHKSQSDASPSYQELMVGSWTTDADTLGKIQVIEVFNKDGTWVYGNSDDILRKGKWQYIDEMQIKINETEVTNDNVSESVNHERLIAIIDLKYDEIVCKEGNRQFVLKRIRHPGFPKSSLNNEEVE